MTKNRNFDEFAMGSAEPMRRKDRRTGEGRERNDRREAIREARRGHDFKRRSGMIEDARADGWL
ncbi:hypothetical protein [Rhizobium phage RHph_X2_26]|nr:hypothetical protein [Rhizobium phage RHph_X2_26]